MGVPWWPPAHPWSMVLLLTGSNFPGAENGSRALLGGMPDGGLKSVDLGSDLGSDTLPA